MGFLYIVEFVFDCRLQKYLKKNFRGIGFWENPNPILRESGFQKIYGFAHGQAITKNLLASAIDWRILIRNYESVIIDQNQKILKMKSPNSILFKF